MSFSPYPDGFNELLATTGLAGFALTGGTPTILSWTAPNDGNMHRIMVVAAMNVSSALTGGQISVSWTDPGGSVGHPTIIAANAAAGNHPGTVQTLLVPPGSTFNLNEGTAVTAGAAVVYAELWGS